MRIFIDDTRLDDAPDAPTAIALAREHIAGADRLIIDINADGEPAPDAILDGTDDGASIAELRFTTADTGTFLSETVHAAKESLDLIRKDQTTAAEQIRAGEMEDAMHALRAIMEGWQGVRDVVDQVAQLAGADAATLETHSEAHSETGSEDGAESGQAIIADLGAALTEIRDTLAQEDWASLGDVVEYDLATLADRWDALLDALIERAARR